MKKSKRIIAIVLALVMIMLCFAGCASKLAKTNETTTQETTKPARNGYDTSTNVEYELNGFVFSMPSYMDKDDEDDDVLVLSSTNTSDIAIKILTGDGKISSDNMSGSALDSATDGIFQKWEESLGEDATITTQDDNVDLSNDDFVIRKHSVKLTKNDKSYEENVYAIFSKETQKYVIVIEAQNQAGGYDYRDDIEKSVINVTEKQEEVSADFKATMDEYEEFFDEYVEFMKNYKSSTNVYSMITDYTKWITQYADMVSKMQSIDTSKLSAADYAYYVEVSARITEKLAEVSESL